MITITSLTQQQFCVCHKLGPKFTLTSVVDQYSFYCQLNIFMKTIPSHFRVPLPW